MIGPWVICEILDVTCDRAFFFFFGEKERLISDIRRSFPLDSQTKKEEGQLGMSSILSLELSPIGGFPLDFLAKSESPSLHMQDCVAKKRIPFITYTACRIPSRKKWIPPY